MRRGVVGTRTPYLLVIIAKNYRCASSTHITRSKNKAIAPKIAKSVFCGTRESNPGLRRHSVTFQPGGAWPALTRCHVALQPLVQHCSGCKLGFFCCVYKFHDSFSGPFGSTPRHEVYKPILVHIGAPGLLV